jgi:hypothetical protein
MGFGMANLGSEATRTQPEGVMSTNNKTSASLSGLFNIIVFVDLVIIFFLNPFVRDYLPQEPFLRNLRLDRIVLGLSALAYLVLIIGVWFTSVRLLGKVVVFILALPFLCVYSTIALTYLISGPEQLVDWAELNRNRYYLVIGPTFGDWYRSYTLYNCPKFGGTCLTMNNFGLIETGDRDEVDLVADPEKDYLYVFQDGELVRAYPNWQNYRMLDRLVIGRYAYVLQSNDRLPEVLLSRCNKDTALDCKVLFERQTGSGSKDASLSFDQASRELQVLVGDQPFFQTVLP